MNIILSISVNSNQFSGLPSGKLVWKCDIVTVALLVISRIVFSLGTPKGLGMFSEVGGHVPCSGISADLKNIQKNVIKKNASVVRNKIIASFMFVLMLFVSVPVVVSRIVSRLQ
ncbi:hypothetical protein T07_13159 [Trichinella nelsoni]|uniref:Transmembrane protein n=1 Tax=Trichinella nelsoni TaxID=6336 RepID=A0A0V0RBP5_9BILA|nr:hypothetical protein T07_13159 [Trichinella nelsoni]